MVEPLRIIVADDDCDMRSLLSRLLSRMGHRVVASVDNGNALVEECLAQQPDLVISDIRMPGCDGLSAASQLCREAPVPVVLLTAHMDQELVQRACESDIMAYLVKPVREPEVEAAIALAMTRFRKHTELRREAKELRQALDDRKVIERAKGILMKRASLDEQAAYRRLQKLASARNMRLADLARRVCDAEEAVDWSD